MITFFGLDLRLEPARKELAEEKDNLAKLIAKVDALSKEYQALVDKVDALEKALQIEIDKLKMLEDQLDTMQRRKVVAVKLTDGLKGEKKTWLEAAEVYKKLVVNVEGDVLISCAVQAYLGAFVLN
jgi:dynein heavy chain